MPLITFGNDTGSIEAQRNDLVRDLRAGYAIIDELGLGKSLCTLRGRIGMRAARFGLRMVVRQIGYPAALRLLGTLNTIAQKNSAYLNGLEKDKAERRRLAGSLMIAFADVKPANAAATANAKVAPAVAIKGCVMGAWGPLLLAAAAAGAGIYFVIRGLNKSSAPTTTALLSFFKRLRMASTDKVIVPAEEYKAAAALASSLGLPKTSASISTNKALPSDELWPDTTTPVSMYVPAWLDKNLPWTAGPVVVTRTPRTPVAGISGGGRTEKDGFGVDSWAGSMEEIVGAAGGRRQMRAGRRLMRIPGTSPEALRISRVTMPDMVVRAGRVTPRTPGMGKMHPGLQAVLDSVSRYRELGDARARGRL